MVVLKLKNVSAELNGEKKIKDLNVLFEGEKIYAILGKRKSGKTFLISILSGIEDRYEGTIEYFINNKYKKINKKNTIKFREKNLGIIFFNNISKQSESLGGILKEILISLGKNKEFDEIIDKCDITKEELKLEINQVAKNKIAKLLISISFLKSDKVILIDDLGFDLTFSEQKQVCNFLIEQNKKYNKTIIFTTEYNYISGFADYIYGLNAGNLNRIK